jgi:hypothetical protein
MQARHTRFPIHRLNHSTQTRHPLPNRDRMAFHPNSRAHRDQSQIRRRQGAADVAAVKVPGSQEHAQDGQGQHVEQHRRSTAVQDPILVAEDPRDGDFERDAPHLRIRADALHGLEAFGVEASLVGVVHEGGYYSAHAVFGRHGGEGL